jgi:hypothetical protein
MTSGRVQMAAVGLQDAFLTGEPDVSYFIKKYPRHSKFALEILDSSFDQQNLDFGSLITCTVPRKGQLIRNMYLSLVLPDLIPNTYGYTDSIGNAIIEYADLLVGGKVVERITGEYMQFYAQMSWGDSQQKALTYLTGDTKAGLTGLGPASNVAIDTQAYYGQYPRTMLVPLPFYFARNESLAFPLCSLTRQEVEVHIKLRPLRELVAYGNPETGVLTWQQYSLSPINFTSVTWFPYSLVFALLAPTNVFYVFNPNSTSLVPVKVSPYTNFTCVGVAELNDPNVVAVSSTPCPTPIVYSKTNIFGTFEPLILPQGNFQYVGIASDGLNNMMALATDGTVIWIQFKGDSYTSGTIDTHGNVFTTVTWSDLNSFFVFGGSQFVSLIIPINTEGFEITPAQANATIQSIIPGTGSYYVDRYIKPVESMSNKEIGAMTFGLGNVWTYNYSVTSDRQLLRYDGIHDPVVVLSSGFITSSIAFTPTNQVWYAGYIEPFVYWFDVNNPSIVTTVNTVANVLALTYGTDGSIWVGSIDVPASLIKINPTTSTVVGTYSIDPTFIIKYLWADFGRVWITCQSAEIIVCVVFDIATSTVVETIDLESPNQNLEFYSIISGFDKVWFALNTKVIAINPTTYGKDTITPNGYYIRPWNSVTSITIGLGYVWVADGTTGYMYGIDPVTQTIKRKISVGTNPNFIAFGLDSVWVASRGIGVLDTGTVTRIFGQGYTSDTSIACDGISILSNTTVTINTLSLEVSPVPAINTTSIAYSPLLDQFMIVGQYPGFWIGSEIQPPVAEVTSSGALQASLPVEYVFLGDDEIKLIQSSKVDYVITQIQMARDVIPAGTTSLPMRLEFINPVKEMFFVIQDRLVLQNNDYFNFTNTSTGTDQLVKLELQFNGETIVSESLASSLFLGYLQYLNNHTRTPDVKVYNYSFATDPENDLPTGQVNMSRIYNKNLYLTLTENPVERDVRVYAKSYNILRIQNGLGGVLFMDNNFY